MQTLRLVMDALYLVLIFSIEFAAVPIAATAGLYALLAAAAPDPGNIPLVPLLRLLSVLFGISLWGYPAAVVYACALTIRHQKERRKKWLLPLLPIVYMLLPLGLFGLLYLCLE